MSALVSVLPRTQPCSLLWVVFDACSRPYRSIGDDEWVSVVTEKGVMLLQAEEETPTTHRAFLAALSVGSQVRVVGGIHQGYASKEMRAKQPSKQAPYNPEHDHQITAIYGAGYTIDWSDGHVMHRVVPASDIYGGSGHEHEIGDTVSAKYDEVELMFTCHGLRNMDTFSKSDPMIICWIQERDLSWKEVQRSEVIQNCLDPEFKVKVKTFHWPEKERVYKFDCYDVDEKKNQQKLTIIGSTGPVQLAKIVGAGRHRTALLYDGQNKGYGDITITATTLRKFGGSITNIHRCPLPPASVHSSICTRVATP